MKAKMTRFKGNAVYQISYDEDCSPCEYLDYDRTEDEVFQVDRYENCPCCGEFVIVDSLSLIFASDLQEAYEIYLENQDEADFKNHECIPLLSKV